jgi:hypothetical protein
VRSDRGRRSISFRRLNCSKVCSGPERTCSALARLSYTPGGMRNVPPQGHVPIELVPGVIILTPSPRPTMEIAGRPHLSQNPTNGALMSRSSVGLGHSEPGPEVGHLFRLVDVWLCHECVPFARGEREIIRWWVRRFAKGKGRPATALIPAILARGSSAARACQPRRALLR